MITIQNNGNLLARVRQLFPQIPEISIEPINRNKVIGLLRTATSTTEQIRMWHEHSPCQESREQVRLNCYSVLTPESAIEYIANFIGIEGTHLGYLYRNGRQSHAVVFNYLRGSLQPFLDGSGRIMLYYKCPVI